MKTIHQKYEELREQEIAELRNRMREYGKERYVFSEDTRPIVAIDGDEPCNATIKEVVINKVGHISLFGLDDEYISVYEVSYGHIEYITASIFTKC